MFVLVKGKIYHSDDAPIMILFTPEELAKFKDEPPRVDIKCSYPPEWGEVRGSAWMNENKGKLVASRDKALRKGNNIVETTILKKPTPPPPVHLSDKDLGSLLDGMDADSIEFINEETEDDR